MLSFQKNFPAYTFEEILHGLTLENLIMYQRATPFWDDEKPEPWDGGLDANDPGNFTGPDDEVFVK